MRALLGQMRQGKLLLILPVVMRVCLNIYRKPDLDEVQKASFDSLCINEGVPELDEVQKASFDSLCGNHSL